MRIVKRGRWRHNGSVEMPVDIVAFEFDWWHEMSRMDGTLDPDEEPVPLGENGLLYYVRFQRAGERSEPTLVDSSGHETAAAAMADAQAQSPAPIRWTR